MGWVHPGPILECSAVSAMSRARGGRGGKGIGGVVSRALRGALPRAPPDARQTVQDAAILHTTLARLLRLPRSADAGRVLRSGAPDGAAVLRSAVAQISAELCGLRATLPTLWCGLRHVLRTESIWC